MEEGLQSLSEDELDEGVQCLPLDEDSLSGEQVPNLDGHEAVVPDFEPSPSMQRKKQRTEVDDLAIDLKGWNLTNVSFNIQFINGEQLCCNVKNVSVFNLN